MTVDLERRYKSIFDLAPVSLWEEDFTDAVAAIDDMKAAGVTDFRAHFTANPGVVGELASKVKVLEVNDYTLALFGAQTKDELIGALGQVFVPESYPVFLEEMVAVATGHRDFASEAFVGTLQGAHLYIYLTLTMLPPRDGRRHALVTVVDISRRKQAEERLAAQEKLYRTLIEATPHMVWMGDASDHLSYCNRAMRDALAMTVDDVQGQDWAARVHDDDRDGVLQARAEAHTSGVPYRGQCRFPDADGGYREFYFIDSPVVDGDGGVTARVGVATDITELKRAQRELQRALDRSNRELMQFAYAASHDLQEPLRMVTSYSQLLAKRYADAFDNRARKYLGYMTQGAQRISALILDLLALSRVNQDGGPLAPTRSQDVLARLLSAMHPELDDAGAEVEVSQPLPAVMADAGQLRQLFGILLANSLKFRSDDPPRVRIGARRESHDETRWRFSVADNGVGFEASRYGARVFEMFRRLHTRDVYPGNGIGLTIAQKIVERHGGRIWAESAPGEGATFLFTLRAIDVEAILE